MSNVENLMKLHFKDYTEWIKSQFHNSPNMKVNCCVCEDGLVGTQINHIGKDDQAKATLMFMGNLVSEDIKEQCIGRLA